MFTSDPKTGSTKPAGLVGPEQQTSFALGTGHNVTVYARRAGPGPMERPVGLVAMDRLVEATNGHTQFWAYSERHVEAALDAAPDPRNAANGAGDGEDNPAAVAGFHAGSTVVMSGGSPSLGAAAAARKAAAKSKSSKKKSARKRGRRGKGKKRGR